MTANTPVIRKISWLALIFQVVFISGIFQLFTLKKISEPLIATALAYFLLARMLRSFLSKDHRKGMMWMMKKNYSEAISSFEASYAWFVKYPWIDKYRFLMLLSASGVSYRSMALDNIAFAYSQTGNGLKAAAYYRKALELNPKDGIAQAGLNMLQSAQVSGVADPEAAP